MTYFRSKAVACVRSLLGLASAMLLMIAVSAPASAANVDELESKLERMEGALQDLQREVYREGGGGSAVGGYDASSQARLNDMEQSLRTLTGQVEQLAFEVRQMREQLDRLDREMQFRLGALESAAGILPPAATTSEIAPSSGGTLTLPGPDGSAGPTELGPPSGGDVAMGPQPGILGEIPVSPPGTPAEAQYETAMDLLSRAQYAPAQSAFRQLVSEYPDSEHAPDAQFFISDIYFVQGQNEDAARGFAEFVKNYPNAKRGPDAMLKLGLALFALGKNDDGCTIIGAIREKFPEAGDTVLSRADREARKNGC